MIILNIIELSFSDIIKKLLKIFYLKKILLFNLYIFFYIFIFFIILIFNFH